MRNSIRSIVLAGSCAACCLLGSARGQEPPAEPEPAAPTEPAVPEEPAVPAEPATETAPKPRHFGLYVSAGIGLADGEPLNTSIVTRASIDQTISEFELPEQQHGRAAIGWKLDRNRGDFRLAYTGYAEDTYELTASGQSVKTFEFPGISTGQDATDFVEWWHVEVENGHWVAARTPRLWVPSLDDANGNGAPDPEEVRADPVDRLIDTTVPESLNNRVQTYDFVYGRPFGGKRYSSRWWAGLRYFEYSGQVVAPAWLGANDLGAGSTFTDNALLSPLLLEQNTSGAGPTGSWEVQFNFYDKRLVLYLLGQTAFVLSELELDSGQFFTLVKNVAGDVITPASRLEEQRKKSVWQNTAEAGARLNLRSGIGFEFGYTITGYLDAIMLPNLIIVPETETQAAAGTTALYSTQDYEVTGWHASMSFQF